jgi:hypothetical protein
MLPNGIEGDPGIDYERVIKKFKTPSSRWNDRDNRYEQPQIAEVTKERICGNPDMGAARSRSRSDRLAAA